MVSEEDDEPIVVEGSSGDYVVVFDPLVRQRIFDFFLNFFLKFKINLKN